ncbi:MAG: YraN family protein [Clostridiales bacterium]|nr:YraN family protein [Clostridiales bacterium]
MSQHDIGLKGERLAAQYLKKQGFELQKQRVRSRHGEIDLIAKKGNHLYFIEVKYRPDARLGAGLQSITQDKRRRLKEAARAYLSSSPVPWRLAFLEITRAGILLYEDVLHEQ